MYRSIDCATFLVGEHELVNEAVDARQAEGRRRVQVLDHALRDRLTGGLSIASNHLHGRQNEQQIRHANHRLRRSVQSVQVARELADDALPDRRDVVVREQVVHG